MVTALSLFNFGFLLIFGVLLSVYFAGVEKTFKNRRAVILFILTMLLLQTILWATLGYEITRKIYPLVTHLPLAIFITLYYKKNWTISFVCVLTAYLCCQTPQWFASVGLSLFGSKTAYHIINLLTILPVLYFLKRYVVSSVNQLMNISRRSLLMFGIVPLMYYLFDYTTTVYTDILYQGIEMAVLFMPSVVSMFYFVFIIIYYKEMQLRSNVESLNMLLSVQIKQSKKDLDIFWETQEKAAIYRHDMRHHLNLIGGFLADGDTKNARNYINRTQSAVEEITPVRYCENNMINLILSYIMCKAKASSITFTIDVQIPQNISIVETELCALLSNSLENAVNACAQVEDEKSRIIHMNSKVHKGKLLIFIENSYTGEVITENDLPKSTQQGHGFGVKSIVMIIDKYKGYYSYTAKDGIFTLRIVLPLEN